MDRLGALDAEFLFFEDDATPMHIGAWCTFEGPAPERGDVTRLVEGRLDRLPRYRQVVQRVPLDLGRPVWVDDWHLRVDEHVHRTALPGPGGDAEVDALMGRLMSQPLDRARPLWEVWVVEGLRDDRWALVCKVHHCMVDGVAGMALLTALLSIDPDEGPADPDPWSPRPRPDGPALVADAWLGLGRDVGRRLAGIPRALARPAETLRAATATTRGLARLGLDLARSPGRGDQIGVGPHRVWTHRTLSLADVKAVRRAAGGTVNDVLFAAVAGGYREWLIDRGEDPSTTRLQVAVPVSVRDPDHDDRTSNEVSVLLARLPVEVADPLDRLTTARRELDDLKGSHEVEGASALLGLAELAPPAAVRAATRLLLRAERRMPQASVNTVVTNVPGPQFPVYCLGRRMTAVAPFVGLSYGVPTVTALLSYDGTVGLGVTGDEDRAPDIGVIADGAVEALAAMVDAVAG